MAPLTESSKTSSHLATMGSVIWAGRQYGTVGAARAVHVDALDRRPGTPGVRVDGVRDRSASSASGTMSCCRRPAISSHDEEAHQAFAVVEDPERGVPALAGDVPDSPDGLPVAAPPK